MSDPVNKPDHYQGQGMECIEAIRAALSPEEFRGYCKGNAIKYLWRADKKGGAEDYAKAAVYVGWLTVKRAVGAERRCYTCDSVWPVGTFHTQTQCDSARAVRTALKREVEDVGR